ncbi:MAG TPA: metalloregulator ArsR/SmtB family transcription factor [Symbiobacteriaceae bacterium]
MGSRSVDREADLLRALGHTTRIRVIEMLTERDTCFCDMQSALKIEQATLSQHLQVLRRMRLVTSRKAGTQTIYRLTNLRLGAILQAATAACATGEPAAEAEDLQLEPN